MYRIKEIYLSVVQLGWGFICLAYPDGIVCSIGEHCQQ